MKEPRTVKLPEDASQVGFGGSDLMESWSVSYSELLAAFTRQFDRGRVANVLESPQRGELVGHGRSSTCYRLKMRGEAMDLAVKAIDVSPDDPHGRVTLLHWEMAVNRAVSAPLVPLIPPMRIVKGEGVWGLVMPFGEPIRTGSRGCTPEQAAYVTAMAARLAERGLCLGDVPQVFAWQNIPFVVDVFDLSKLA